MASAEPSAERGLIERAEPVPGTEMPFVSCLRIQHGFPNSLGAAERVIPSLGAFEKVKRYKALSLNKVQR